MSRTASPLTLAIRALCFETSGEIKHSEARPQLEGMGFQLATKPPRRSGPDYLKELKEYDVDYDDPEVVGIIANTLGIDEEMAQAVLVEREWAAEVNNFNVVKNLWKKHPEDRGEKPSGKVATTPTATATRPPAKRGRPKKAKVTAPTAVEAGDMEALEFVETNGGLPNVRNLLVEAEAEVARLQSIVETVEAVVARVNKVAA